MTGAVALVCSRCGASELQRTVSPGVHADPEAWSTVQVSGTPTVTAQLCGSCSRTVRQLLTTPPVSDADREAAFDALVEASWTEGYESGQAEHWQTGYRAGFDAGVRSIDAGTVGRAS